MNTVYTDLMHQFIDIKHGLAPQPPTVVSCSITSAMFFRRFEKVAGMSGTAVDVSATLWDAYSLSVRPSTLVDFSPMQRSLSPHRAPPGAVPKPIIGESATCR